MLSQNGRTMLSRAYGMADEERGIRNSAKTRFTLTSAGKPFHTIAVLQLAQQGKLRLDDPVGKHLTGFPADVAERVTIHHLLSGASGTDAPPEEVERITYSRAEVHDFYAQRARQARLTGTPGLPSETHQEANTTIPALIVEAVSGLSYWDYVEKFIFRRAGMTDSGFFTRTQWLNDRTIAHPYMQLADGSYVDALRNLDEGSPLDHIAGKNPGRIFIDAPGDGGFATAPDLVRFVRALHDGTLLSRQWLDVLIAPKAPTGPASFGAYGIGVEIFAGQWTYQRAGGNPGVGANWTVFPETGWTGAILINRDAGDLIGMLAKETEAITGVAPDSGTGG
ncbi:serine hydrolase domain-containing protein [Actinoplanes couchii]|uniref:Serine hydrolase n=2 Tax=Actinoplanes couchii TaxID=403638 RepID=A0ABQ3XE28_9ACTN|nr:serine hydrolase [Actinoplanes couchii]